MFLTNFCCEPRSGSAYARGRRRWWYPSLLLTANSDDAVLTPIRRVCQAACKTHGSAYKISAIAGWAANRRFEISKFKFKFPRSRTFELYRARSRLYRSRILKVNMHLKALAEIYTMHSFAQLCNLNLCQIFNL